MAYPPLNPVTCCNLAINGLIYMIEHAKWIGGTYMDSCKYIINSLLHAAVVCGYIFVIFYANRQIILLFSAYQLFIFCVADKQ